MSSIFDNRSLNLSFITHTEDELDLAKKFEKNTSISASDVELLIRYKPQHDAEEKRLAEAQNANPQEAQTRARVFNFKSLFGWLRPRRMLSGDALAITNKIAGFKFENFNPKLMQIVLEHKKHEQMRRNQEILHTRDKRDSGEITKQPTQPQSYDHFASGIKELELGKTNAVFENFNDAQYSSPESHEKTRQAIIHFKKAEKHFEAALSRETQPDQIKQIKEKLVEVRGKLTTTKAREQFYDHFKLAQEEVSLGLQTDNPANVIKSEADIQKTKEAISHFRKAQKHCKIALSKEKDPKKRVEIEKLLKQVKIFLNAAKREERYDYFALGKEALPQNKMDPNEMYTGIYITRSLVSVQKATVYFKKAKKVCEAALKLDPTSETTMAKLEQVNTYLLLTKCQESYLLGKKYKKESHDILEDDKESYFVRKYKALKLKEKAEKHLKFAQQTAERAFFDEFKKIGYVAKGEKPNIMFYKEGEGEDIRLETGIMINLLGSRYDLNHFQAIRIGAKKELES